MAFASIAWRLFTDYSSRETSQLQVETLKGLR